MKKTITMSATRETAIKRAVAEGRAPSESSYVEQALAAFDAAQSHDDFLAAWRREVGAATPEEKAWARAAVEATKGSAERR